MIAAAGFVGVLMGVASAAWLAVRGFRAQRQPGHADPRYLRPPVYGLVGGSVLAMAALEVALLANDFSIRYVATNSARATPLLFKVATAWASLEGSIVLWGLVLACYTAAVFWRFRPGDRLSAGALAVMGVVAVFFFGLMATAANPFHVLASAPPDGLGPNPLLQNHVLMAFHPPVLYLGYVGFTVPFAFAMSALLLGRESGGAEWLRRTRRFGLVAWCFLTAGIVLGAWWSYEVLGWGGYWAWDPVENASLIPWLAATAFIHSAVVQARRGMLRTWNFSLVIATFALTILGTLLTRSGVIASVHSFTQSAVGPLLLGFFLAVLLGGFGLFAVRASQLASARRLESLASREGALLVNNLILSVLAFAVATGTIYPIFVEAFTGAQVSVGRPFFDRMAVPLSLALLLFMTAGPVAPYRSARAAVVWERMRLAVLTGLAMGAGLVVLGVRVPYVVVVAMTATVIVAVAVRQLVVTARSAGLSRRRPRSLVAVMRRDPAYWGGQIAHIGIALVALAVALTGNLSSRASLSLTQGEPASFGSYELVYEESVQRQEPTHDVVGARIAVRQDGRTVKVLEPRLNRYANTTQLIGTPAVWTRPTEDLYLALTRLEDGRVSVNAFRHPFMWLLWVGGMITALGGVWAVAARQRERRAGLVPDTAPGQEVVSVPEEEPARV